MVRAWTALLLTILAGLAAAGPARAADALAAPKGPVVLTVAGSVAHANRPEFDAFDDSFLAYHERHFKRAAAFDVAMLEALGTREMHLKVPGWPREVTVEGPSLEDVLAAAGTTGGLITLVALDGYAIELTRDQLHAEDWLLAIKRDGHYLNLGGRGPTWIVYARTDGQPATVDDEARWPWSVFYIEVR